MAKLHQVDRNIGGDLIPHCQRIGDVVLLPEARLIPAFKLDTKAGFGKAVKALSQGSVLAVIFTQLIGFAMDQITLDIDPSLLHRI